MIEIPTPSGTFRDWPALHRETRRAYRYLLQRKRPLVISSIDEDGFPWANFRIRHRGRVEHHSMMLNHGGLVTVNRRNK